MQSIYTLLDTLDRTGQPLIRGHRHVVSGCARGGPRSFRVLV